MSAALYDLGLCTSIYPPTLGGPATYLPRFALHASQRTKLFVLAPEGSDAIPGIDHFFYRRKYGVKALGVLFCEALLAAKIRWAAQRCKVMYCHGTEFALGILFGLGAQRGLSCRWAFKFTGYNPWEWVVARHRDEKVLLLDFAAMSPWTVGRSWGLRAAILHTIFRSAMRRMDLIITPGSGLVEVLVRLGVSPQRVQVVHNPMAISDSTNGSSPARPLKLITGGRLVRHKQIEELIAWLGPKTDVRLDIIGSGDEEHHLREAAAPYANVRFLGALTRPQVKEKIAQSDVFVLNSSYEGLSHMLLECIAVKRCFAASHIPGNAEVHHIFGTQCSRLYDLHDKDACWKAIEDAHQLSPDWVAVRRIFETELSENVIFERTEALLLGGVS